ncbi:putative oxoglutarate iron-dependent oxygenase protein [Rosellinia necatrix]|uniref:Putative oxoglutarate iron-dependent oxygenase protein n=1 Tax=Rosellinia necatrix TaxID=77044 RepID=A0A1W2TS29_ROSNE|nr:putative oxoglutarate iron-dependent oxygenase protein [Rosellinia necatrix]
MASTNVADIGAGSRRVSLRLKRKSDEDIQVATSEKLQKITATLAIPVGKPSVASNVRAALCDSIDYWKAHQGGIHSQTMVATGMLLNGKTTPRDVLQAQVIITTVGGGLTTADDGKHIRTEDQNEKCKNLVTLKNAKKLGQPIGVVVGKQPSKKGEYMNNLLSIKLDNHYNVLDWFFITDIWEERQPIQRDGTSFVHYVVRLQLIDLDSMPWWVPENNTSENIHTIGEFKCETVTCKACDAPSKEIFKQGWCCLAKTCSEFFRFADSDVDTEKLEYSESFLNERTAWSSDRPLSELVPRLPTLGKRLFGSEVQFKRGIVCPTCNYACRRISWEGWHCEKGCGFAWPMPPRDVPMSMICKENVVSMKGKSAKFYEVDSRIQRVEHAVAGYEVTTFYLPNAPGDVDNANFIGSVTVFRPLKSTLERKGGLNDLFSEIQKTTREGDVKLRRNPAFCRGSHMEELTSHFSCNMGADYKFGVVVETSNGFDTAPDPVMKALGRLTWSGAKAVALTTDHIASKGMSVDAVSMPDQFVEFNEQLMLGYFQGSQISYHDDGEKELGPTVATLSLGSPSIMRFRGKRKAGFENTIGNGRVMLSFVLQHGDMVVMHGTKIHKHYEHAVSALGIRRYALTCRYIRPEMIPNKERREKAIKNGKVPAHWQDQAYEGEGADASHDN